MIENYIIFSDEFPVIDWSQITLDHKIMVAVDGKDAEAVHLLALLAGFNPYQKAQDDTPTPYDLVQLNALYPSVPYGFMLVCPFAGKYYEKVRGNNGGEPPLNLWVEWDIRLVGVEVDGIFDHTFDPTFE